MLHFPLKVKKKRERKSNGGAVVLQSRRRFTKFPFPRHHHRRNIPPESPANGNFRRELRLYGGIIVEFGGKRVGQRRAGFGGHTGELRRVRLSLPLAAGDMQFSSPEPLLPRRRVVRRRVGGKAPLQLPPPPPAPVESRRLREPLQKGHLRLPRPP